MHHAPVRAEDGSHISASAGPQVRRCEVCGEELGCEQWWVTQFPHGVHTRCRDWSGVAFPFGRHLGLLRRMRFQTEGEARVCVNAAERWLARFARAWPRPGAEGVLTATAMLARLRARLVALGVETKVANHL